MEHLQIILPAVLLLIGFLLKLLIGRKCDLPAAIQAVCELPVDIILLSLSFIVAFTIAKVDNQASGLFYCFIGFLITILIVLFWRFSIDAFFKGAKWWILYLVLNFFLSGFAVIKSVSLIMEAEKKELINNNFKPNLNLKNERHF
ncbi:MAG TPA: hypothetical protein VIM75_21905 [Ohtaekwangia sp.]|uniref:hypothetical protein n=1 Tax=Ohtaekwangia sp. TaxID=2066019 RepID=UPI002F9254EB